MPDLTEYIETSEAAEKLHYYVEHVHRMMREGSLKGIKIGRTWLVQRKSLEVCCTNSQYEQTRS